MKNIMRFQFLSMFLNAFVSIHLAGANPVGTSQANEATSQTGSATATLTTFDHFLNQGGFFEVVHGSEQDFRGFHGAFDGTFLSFSNGGPSAQTLKELFKKLTKTVDPSTYYHKIPLVNSGLTAEEFRLLSNFVSKTGSRISVKKEGGTVVVLNGSYAHNTKTLRVLASAQTVDESLRGLVKKLKLCEGYPLRECWDGLLRREKLIEELAQIKNLDDRRTRAMVELTNEDMAVLQKYLVNYGAPHLESGDVLHAADRYIADSIAGKVMMDPASSEPRQNKPAGALSAVDTSLHEDSDSEPDALAGIEAQPN